jgi:hypothetical protein
MSLVDLARRFVTLSEELEQVRDDIRRCVLNGAGDADHRPPTQARRGAGHPAAIRSAEAEDRILTLLKDRPGLRTAEIAEATAAKKTTTVERLRRLREKGTVTGGGNEGWSATATA